MGFPKKLLNPGEEVAVDVRPHWKYLFGPVFLVIVALAGSIVAIVADVPQWAELVLAGVLVVCLAWLLGRYVRWATTSFVVTNERLVMRRGILRRSGREILIDRLTDISYTQSLLDRMLGCGDVLLESPGRDSPETFVDLPHPVAIQNEIYRLINQRRPATWGGTGDWAPSQVPPDGAPLAAVPLQPGAGGLGGPPGGPVGAPAAGTGAPGAWGAGTTAAGGTTGAVAGAEPTVAEQLSQLDDLRKRGVISRREFAAKKAELLSRM
jgi:membrane protein YdbS with pleckstrin-like domain